MIKTIFGGVELGEEQEKRNTEKPADNIILKCLTGFMV